VLNLVYAALFVALLGLIFKLFWPSF